jgi:hypothetical protein
MNPLRTPAQASHWQARKLTRQSSQSLRGVALDRDNSALSGLSWQPLELNVLSLLLCLPLLKSVALDTVEELLSALGVLDVLDTKVDTLLEVTTVDDLVADDTDGTGGDVVDDTGLSVVD